MTENANPETETGERAERRSRLAGCAPWLVLPGILLVFLGIPYALLALAFWSVEGSWDFEGDRSFRYWSFVSGKRVERLGVVAPTDKPVKYSVRGSDGNFPGWAIVIYESKAAPDAVIDAYAKRCESLKAKVTERGAPERKEDKISVSLACEFEDYHTAEFQAERKSSSSISDVALRVWGRD